MTPPEPEARAGSTPPSRRRLLILLGGIVVAVAAAVVLVVVLQHRPPSAAQLAAAIYDDGHDEAPGELWLGLVNEGVTRSGARCMAEALIGADVPDDALWALVEHDGSVKVGDLQERIGPRLTMELGGCMTAMGPGVSRQSPGNARP